MTVTDDATDDAQTTTMSRRSVLGATGALGAALFGVGGSDGRDEPQATMGYRKGVLRVAATGVHEDESLSLTFRACGETWTLVREGTEYRSGEWRHVGDVDKTGISHERWQQAQLVGVEIVEADR